VQKPIPDATRMETVRTRRQNQPRKIRVGQFGLGFVANRALQSENAHRRRGRPRATARRHVFDVFFIFFKGRSAARRRRQRGNRRRNRRRRSGWMVVVSNGQRRILCGSDNGFGIRHKVNRGTTTPSVIPPPCTSTTTTTTTTTTTFRCCHGFADKRHVKKRVRQKSQRRSET